ncbi:MAG: ATP-dependent DNA helicase RecG, partial [Solobacterium sp.]|nr:ATP-dependent DNA helicase RecG [Solobacterium sp.]
MDLHDKSLKLTPKRIETLNRLGLYDTDAVLSYYPMRYDVLNGAPFETWKEKDKVTFQGEVVKAARVFRRGKMSSASFEVMAFDRVLKITIYNRPWVNQLQLNQQVTITGIYQGKNRVTATSYDLRPLSEHAAVTPVYSTKAGITQKMIAACVAKVFEAVQNEIHDLVPSVYIRAYRLLTRAEALRRIHFPESMADVQSAVRTIKYEEFLRFFISVSLMKDEDERGIFKDPVRFEAEKMRKVVANLPYRLTADQKAALDEIFRDMCSNRPMYRLLQGDVGCGKTTVAALAMYACVLSKRQAALLAPTEILALQHLSSLRSLLKDTGVRAEVIYAGLAGEERRKILAAAAAGEVDILIGTHALLQGSVVFQKLGLVIADEQQRFGVEQRRSLRMKGENADFLLMSATPIPRTLASTLYGDMDISTIQTMPPGRIPPLTKRIGENSFRSVLADVRALLEKGHQLYVICAAVEENEDYDARDVTTMAANIQELFPSYHVGMLHGRMHSDQKKSVMDDFAANRTQILVSTTVVEVGVNVVNATGMIVYDADRFGLSQLHQLRGRVGRG